MVLVRGMEGISASIGRTMVWGGATAGGWTIAPGAGLIGGDAIGGAVTGAPSISSGPTISGAGVVSTGPAGGGLCTVGAEGMGAPSSIGVVEVSGAGGGGEFGGRGFSTAGGAGEAGVPAPKRIFNKVVERSPMNSLGLVASAKSVCSASIRPVFPSTTLSEAAIMFLEMVKLPNTTKSAPSFFPMGGTCSGAMK